jgi:multiple sugar transport system substrate-binding protein
MSKKLKIVSAIALASMMLSACSTTGNGSAEQAKGGSTKGEKITVLLPKAEMDTIGFYEKETRQFEKDTGIKVELINMAWDSLADKITAEMTANGSSYDVIEFDNAWVAKFPTNNWIVPLDSYISEDMKKGILPGLLQKFSYQGKLYGIPWNNDTRFFMYNKKKLDDAGIKAPPKTWAELKEQSQILMQKGLVKYGFTDAYIQNQSGFDQMAYNIYSFGGDFFDKSGNPSLATNQAAKDAYNFIVNGLNKDKFIDPASLTASYETAGQTFVKGDTAFFIQGWPGLYQIANDPAQSKIVDQIAVAPYSVGVNDNSKAVLTLPEAMAITSTSKHKDASWQYIKYMSTKEFDKKRATAIGGLPIWTDMYKDADLLKLYPYWKDFGAQSEHARGLPDLTWFDEYANMVMVESQKMLMGQVSAEQGLKSIDEQAKQMKH